MQASDENKEKNQLWNYPMIQYQILQDNIMRIIWQTVKRITKLDLGRKRTRVALKKPFYIYASIQSLNLLLIYSH